MAGMAELPLCHSSGALVLTCYASPGSGHLSLTEVSNREEQKG